MVYEKETKRTYRFFDPKGVGLIGILYVKKMAFAKQPKKIKVTVEVIE